MPTKYGAIALLAGVLASCNVAAKKHAAAITGGDPDRGASNISRYGCGSCHTIPGITGAHGMVGPSLSGIGNREFIADALPNQPVNLMRWVRDPHGVQGNSVMPNLGVTSEDAMDIAAYLYSLK